MDELLGDELLPLCPELRLFQLTLQQLFPLHRLDVLEVARVLRQVAAQVSQLHQLAFLLLQILEDIPFELELVHSLV